MILAFLAVLVGLVLIYGGVRGYGQLRESRHAKTLRHIREMELSLGISANDYWSDDPPATADLAIAKRSYIPPFVELMKNPYSFSFRENEEPKEEVNLGPAIGVRMIDVPAGQLPPR